MTEASPFTAEPGGRRATRIVLSLLVGAIFTDVLFDDGLSAAGALLPGIVWSVGELHRFVFSILLPGGPVIAFANLLVLWFLGPAAEHFYGEARFFTIFGLAGLGSAVATAALRPGDLAMVATGGVLGLVGVLAGLVVFRRVAMSAEIERRITIAVGVGATLLLVLCAIERFINPVAGAAGLVVGLLLSLVLSPVSPDARAGEPLVAIAVGLVLVVAMGGLFWASDAASLGTLPAAMVEAEEHEIRGDLTRAIAVMEQALSSELTGSAAEVTRPAAQNLLAWLHLEFGRHLDRGIALSQESNRAVPENPMFLDTLGYLYALAGRCAEAEDAMGQATAIHGGFARRRDAVARACAAGARPDLNIPVDDPPAKATPEPASNPTRA